MWSEYNLIKWPSWSLLSRKINAWQKESPHPLNFNFVFLKETIKAHYFTYNCTHQITALVSGELILMQKGLPGQ